MDDRTITALRASIKKWTATAQENDPLKWKIGVLYCPLCIEFLNSKCEGCPIKTATGKIYCMNTPYQRAADAHTTWRIRPDNAKYKEVAQSNAWEEVRFLESLLPKKAEQQETAMSNAQEVKISDRGLVSEGPHENMSGRRRIYRLSNGYRLSAINAVEAHSYPYAWEIAVLFPNGENMCYTTPLTSDVEVFDTTEEANAFIDKAHQWANESVLVKDFHKDATRQALNWSISNERRANALGEAFQWSDTPQGYAFWYKEEDNLQYNGQLSAEAESYLRAMLKLKEEEEEKAEMETDEKKREELDKKFPVGTRVHYNGVTALGGSKQYGTVVRNVISGSESIAVEFDEPFNGGHDCREMAKSGRGWYCSPTLLELINPSYEEAETMSGNKVRIYARDVGEDKRIHGAVYEYGTWVISSWYSDGNHAHSRWALKRSPPKRVRQTVWVNLYKNGSHSSHSSEATARGFPREGRVACVAIEIDVPEGYNLEAEVPSITVKVD